MTPNTDCDALESAKKPLEEALEQRIEQLQELEETEDLPDIERKMRLKFRIMKLEELIKKIDEMGCEEIDGRSEPSNE